MSYYVDEKYIRLIASDLKLFKHKGNRLYSFRCPFCNDSKKKQFKVRGYLYYNEGYFFRCHNCARSHNFYSFLKHINPSLHRQYVLETFTNKHVVDIKTPVTKTVQEPEIFLDSLQSLPDDHWCLQYVRNRKIPEKFWNELYFTPDFENFMQELFPKVEGNFPSDSRLVFPIYDENVKLQGINARALNSSTIRYISKKISDDAIKLYGLHRVDKTKKIYVFEGPIDSLFVENAVATCDSDLMRSAKYLPKENLVLVFDNQYYNKEVRKTIDKAINDGFNVCLFPNMKEKDVNDMIMNGISEEDIKTLIDNHTFCGLRAMVELKYR